MAVDWIAAQLKAKKTGRWAVTMAKVRIRQVLANTRWQLVTFCGVAGGESVGIVDLLAVRKNHSKPIINGTKRGDALQIILIQVKGGRAAKPTTEDGKRLKAVADQLNAQHILLATWKKGTAARFYEYQPDASKKSEEWADVLDLDAVFQ